MKKPILLFSLFIVFIFPRYLKAQGETFKYGWNENYNYFPSDIINTEDGGFLLLADIYYNSYDIENYIIKNILIRVDSNGDTLWTRYYKHDWFGTSGIIELENGNILTIGEVGNGFSCQNVSIFMPYYSNLSINRYLSNGDSLQFNNINIGCIDEVIDIIKRNDESFVALIKTTHSPSSSNLNLQFNILDCNKIGDVNLSSYNSTFGIYSQIEIADDGYWLANSNKIIKLNSNNNILFESVLPNPLNLPISDFCKVDNDSLVFIHSSIDPANPDIVSVLKTDSSGNMGWVKQFNFRARDILYHSSGNYILAGYKDSSIIVLALNANGDFLWSETYQFEGKVFLKKIVETLNGKLAIIGYEYHSFYSNTPYPTRTFLILDTMEITLNTKNDLTNALIEVFPNPTNNVLNIKSNTPLIKCNLEIRNMLGQIIAKYDLNNQYETLRTDNLVNGNYIYIIKSENQIVKQGKLIISH